MAQLGLVGAHSRKKWRRGKRDTVSAPDLLERDFTAESSDLRWVGDITEFKCADGKLFLAGVLDLHDRSLAGWSMAVRQTADLTVNALVMALGRGDPDTDLVSHQDHGAQGGFNRSSQHLEREVVDGQASRMDDRVDGAISNEVPGFAVAAA